MKSLRLSLAALLVLSSFVPMAKADAISDFYSGKTIRLIVATPPGGPYDNHARLLARHLGDHIPGHPAIVVENLAGGTGMIAANYVYNIGPQDGTVLANLHNMLALIKALGQSDLKVDPARFNWIGNMTREVGDVILSTKSPIKTIDDAKHETAVIGAPGSMALGTIYPRVMNYVLGTKFKVVTGYDGAAGVEHALEQGEVDGDAGDTWFSGQGNTYDWYKAGKIRVLVQIGTRTPDLPNVPLLVDLASNKDDRALLELFSSPYTVGKPTAVGPKVPADRVAALRAAYVATMQDPAFLADAKKLGADIAPVSGEELTALMAKLANLPPALLQRAKQAIAPPP
jgi:tripartite-type tricarboxylate transporter receptor subunit TctC